MKNNTIKIVSTYISVILGAGFISGKEIFFFFGNYNYFGIFTLLLACILFSIILSKQLHIVFENKITQYHDFSDLVFNKNIKPFIEYITLLFLFVTMSTMISAFCTSLGTTSIIDIGTMLPKVIIFFLTLFVLLKGVDFIVILNSILTPVMFIGIIIIGVYLIANNSVHTFNDMNIVNSKTYIKGIIFAIIYISFNSLTSVPMMCNILNILESKKTIKISAIISGIILFILGFLLLYPMILDSDFIKKTSLPVLTLLSKNSMLVENIYLIVLLCAIFSTLISTCLSFIKTIETIFKVKPDSILLKIFVILLALIFSNLGFSTFVSVVYPIFGILGLVQIYFILTYQARL